MASSAGFVALGAILGASLFGLVLLISGGEYNEPPRRRSRALMGLSSKSFSAEDALIHDPLWEGVLPANIVDQQLPMVRNRHYGLHVIALGANGSLFHKYQTGPPNMSALMPAVPMSKWLCLTPATHKNTSGVANPLIFGNAPTIALNADGRIELFVGYKPDSLDVWQMYQTDPTDPLAWSEPRAPYCDPSFADCRKCLAKPECKATFWSDGYTWTTSQQSLWLDPEDQKLRLTWRSFDGHIYEKVQSKPSQSEHWETSALQYAVFE